MQAVRDMVQNKRHRLIIGMDDLRNHSLDLARRWVFSPACVLPVLAWSIGL
jgi:DNA replication licensing factor MCM3